MPHGHPANAYRTVVPPTVGLRASSTHTVTEADTAINQGSGEVPVLATPRLVALFEQTTLTALAGHLEADQTTVGMRIHVDHLFPSGVGDTIRTDVEAEQVEGRRITFRATATCVDRCAEGDPAAVVGAATIVRVVVDTDRFLQRVR